MEAMRSMPARRRWVLAAATVIASSVLLLLVVDPGPGDRAVDPPAFLLLAAAGAPLALGERRWPIASVAVASAGIAYIALDYELEPIYPAVLVTLFRLSMRSRRGAMITGLVAAAAAAITIASASDDPLLSWESIGDGALLLVPVLAGDAVRWRRTAHDELIARVAAEERTRIAHGLHDVLTHTVTSLNVQAGVLAREDGLSDELAVAVGDLRRTTGDALDELRAFFGMLRAGDVLVSRPSATLADVRELADDHRARLGAIAIVGDGWTCDVSPAVSRAAHQLVADGLANAARHAPGRDVELRADANQTDVWVSVENRVGRASTTRGLGVGLEVLDELVVAVGGSLAFDNDGTTFRLVGRFPRRQP